jgi:membrane protein implicated in regulation of membrane protease activity
MTDPKVSRTDTNIMIIGQTLTCVLDGILRLNSIIPWIPLPIIFFLVRSVIKRDGMILVWSAAAVYFGTATYLMGLGGVWTGTAAVMGFGAGLGMMGWVVWREVAYRKAQKIRLEEDVRGKRGIAREMDEKEEDVVPGNERS